MYSKSLCMVLRIPTLYEDVKQSIVPVVTAPCSRCYLPWIKGLLRPSSYGLEITCSPNPYLSVNGSLTGLSDCISLKRWEKVIKPGYEFVFVFLFFANVAIDSLSPEPRETKIHKFHLNRLQKPRLFPSTWFKQANFFLASPHNSPLFSALSNPLPCFFLFSPQSLRLLTHTKTIRMQSSAFWPPLTF